MDIQVYFDEDNEKINLYHKERDYRFGVIVVSNQKKYMVNIYGITRLNQEFQEACLNGEVFYIEPNLIIVSNVDKNSIIKSIVEIGKGYNFLSQLKEVDVDLSKYVRVY